MRLIGDIHGDFNWYRECIKDVDSSVQIGDFGIGFGDPSPTDLSLNHRFIRGNHDNPEACKNDPHWIPDGHHEMTSLGPMMFIGGAWSIDREWRTPGFDWWPDEQINDFTFGNIYDTYMELKPTILITHDCPYSVNRRLFNNGQDIQTHTASWFDVFLANHRPKLWFFGHWHQFRDETISGTRFICIPINSWVDLKI